MMSIAGRIADDFAAFRLLRDDSRDEPIAIRGLTASARVAFPRGMIGRGRRPRLSSLYFATTIFLRLLLDLAQ